MCRAEGVTIVGDGLAHGPLAGYVRPSSGRTRPYRPFTLVGVNPALDAFAEPAAELKRSAESSAVRSGRELAELRGSSAA